MRVTSICFVVVLIITFVLARSKTNNHSSKIRYIQSPGVSKRSILRALDKTPQEFKHFLRANRKNTILLSSPRFRVTSKGRRVLQTTTNKMSNSNLSSGSTGACLYATNFRACIQPDSNLVVYMTTLPQGVVPPAECHIWARDRFTSSDNGPYLLAMQNDANLVIYDKKSTPV
jgi:hypothetical protein